MRLFIVLWSIAVSLGAFAADSNPDSERCARTGTGDDIIAACTRAIASSELSAAALAGTYYNRGTKWRAKGESDRAIADFDAAIKLDPQHAQAYNNRGAAWQGKDDIDRAIMDYSEAIRLDPKIVGAYNNRALAWLSKGENDRAIADYDEAIRLNPKYTQAYNNRALAWQAKGDYDRAIADYGAAIRINPQYAVTYYNRALMWQAKGDNDRAIADYGEAIRFNLQFAEAYNNRGYAWRAKGDTVRAIADYSEAIRFNPRNVNAYIALAWLLATSSDANARDGMRAVQMAEKAGELGASNEPVHFDLLAAAYAESGRYAAAVRYEERALESPDFEKVSGTAARERLSLYLSGKPYHENPPAVAAEPATATKVPATPAAQSPAPAAAPADVANAPAAPAGQSPAVAVAPATVANAPAVSAAQSPKPAATPVRMPKYSDLITAVMLQDEDAVRDLLDFGKWVEIKGEAGFTPLLLAAKLNDLKIAQLLLARGANPNHRNNARLSALDYARQNRSDSMISLLRKYGAQEN